MIILTYSLAYDKHGVLLFVFFPLNCSVCTLHWTFSLKGSVSFWLQIKNLYLSF